MVGLIPTASAVESLSGQVLDRFPGFKRRVQWFIENRPDFRPFVETREGKGGDLVWTLALVNRSRIKSVLKYLLDESEFLSPHGIRALSRHHKDKPYVLWVDGREYRVDYEPAESGTVLSGGNSNWRGPIWFPVNFLIIEALQRYHFYLGDSFVVEYPTGSGVMLNLWQVAEELSRRLMRIFLRTSTAAGPSSATPARCRRTRTSGTTCSSTSTSTETTARVSGRATRRAGPGSWPSSCSRRTRTASRLRRTSPSPRAAAPPRGSSRLRGGDERIERDEEATGLFVALAGPSTRYAERSLRSKWNAPLRGFPREPASHTTVSAPCSGVRRMRRVRLWNRGRDVLRPGGTAQPGCIDANVIPGWRAARSRASTTWARFV